MVRAAAGPAALFGYIAVVLVLTVWRLGPRGGDFQRRIHDLIVARAAVDPARRGLDIGCGTFDVVISCLTFHEVRDVTDKSLVIAEALRVLRPGGRYVLLDLFADPGAFGSVQRVMIISGMNLAD
jgi:ubiquinone/menaquinone biosynthesis C-methylase UbiE